MESVQFVFFSKDSSPDSQTKKCCLHSSKISLLSTQKNLAFSPSKSAINKLAYGGTNVVLIAVPHNCLKVFSLNSKMLFFNTISVGVYRVF